MVETLEGRLLEDWVKARTPTGIPYYANHSRGVTQWDHPEYVRILEEVQAANSVKYAAYRTACKLRRLQTRLRLHEVSLQCVVSTFDNAGLRAAENNDMIEVKQIEQVINQILRTTYKNRHVHTSLATQLTLNLILNLLDKSRSGMVQVLGCKVLMIVMCAGRLQEKYRYLFTQIADHNNCCTRRRLAALLRDLARIPELLSEQPSFGISLVSAAVESCFKEVEGEVGVTEEVLLAWLLQEPQTLVWWTTLYRLTAAELVCHDVKCGVCKQRPIIGLRYQCLRCIGYNLCQDCFLHARTSRRHKLSHPIQEYCHETTGKEWRRSLVKMLRNRFGGRQGYNKQRYLSIASSPESGYDLTSLLCEDGGQAWCENSEDEVEDEEELMSRTILHPSEDSDSTHSGEANSGDSGKGSRGNGSPTEPTIMPTTPRHQIHSVIMHLEEGHRQLEEEATGVSQSKVEEHTQQLQTQINRLKAILQSYTSLKAEPQIKPGGARASVRGLPRLESTPIVGERGLLLNLSPIVKQPSADDTAVLDNKENHLAENPDATPIKENKTIQPMRMPFTPRGNGFTHRGTPSNANTQENHDIASSRAVPQPARLPSFTEINFSDLTSMTSAPSSGATSPRIEEKGNVVFGDDVASDVREELENILHQLDQIFPLCKTENSKAAEVDNAGVVEAACELGDVLAEYVSTVPSPTVRV